MIYVGKNIKWRHHFSIDLKDCDSRPYLELLSQGKKKTICLKEKEKVNTDLNRLYSSRSYAATLICLWMALVPMTCTKASLETAGL